MWKLVGLAVGRMRLEVAGTAPHRRQQPPAAADEHDHDCAADAIGSKMEHRRLMRRDALPLCLLTALWAAERVLAAPPSPSPSGLHRAATLAAVWASFFAFYALAPSSYAAGSGRSALIAAAHLGPLLAPIAVSSRGGGGGVAAALGRVAESSQRLTELAQDLLLFLVRRIDYSLRSGLDCALLPCM